MILFPTEYQDIYFSSGLFVTNSLSNTINNSVQFFIERYMNGRINCTNRDVSLIRGEEVRGWRLENAEIADVPHSVTAAARAAAVLQLALCRIFNCWTAAPTILLWCAVPGAGKHGQREKRRNGTTGESLLEVCQQCDGRAAVAGSSAAPEYRRTANIPRDSPHLRDRVTA